jgi:hypothetical protein
MYITSQKNIHLCDPSTQGAKLLGSWTFMYDLLYSFQVTIHMYF